MSNPIFRFGVVTDLHYAPDLRIANRHCADSLDKLSDALITFRDASVDCVLCLGDMVNGGDQTQAESRALEAVTKALGSPGLPVHAVAGNHDMAAFPIDGLIDRMGSALSSGYYRVDYGPLRFVVLDANYNLDGSHFAPRNLLWDQCIVPQQQLDWLADALALPDDRRAIVFIHENLDFRAWNGDRDPHVVVNHAEVRDVLDRSDRVIAVLQGHCHAGHYSFVGGLHYVTFRALVEGEGKANNAYAIVTVNDKMSLAIEGFGRQQGYRLENPIP